MGKTEDKTKNYNNDKSKVVQEKIFIYRNSLLDELRETNPHIRTLYYVVIASLMCLILHTAINDLTYDGYTTLSLDLILFSFGNIHIAIIYWLSAFITTILVYYFFKIWSKLRLGFKIFDYVAICILIFYYVTSFYVASKIVTKYELPAASAAIILTEQVRLLMKVHSFVRSNVHKALKNVNLPSFGQYFYFLFAPTLIYKDEYPRVKHVRWNFVFYRFLELVGGIMFQCLLFKNYFMPPFKDFGVRHYTWLEIINVLTGLCLPALLNHILGFYTILHSVQNFFGELLKFGDRQFYTQWWTSTTYADYFRNWNIVIHDWLFHYIYKDSYTFIFKNKTYAKLTVFIISAIVHEWILTYLIGFFFPLLFAQFFFFASTLSIFVKFPQSGVLSTLFWFQLALGNGMLYGLYFLEYYARTNIPSPDNLTIKDYFVPRFISSGYIQ